MRSQWWTLALLAPVGLLGTLWILGAFMLWPVPMIATLVVIPAAVGVLVLRSRRRQQRAVIARAEYEHAAVLRGEMGLGVYGRFQPPMV
jgi:hypothetical protein